MSSSNNPQPYQQENSNNNNSNKIFVSSPQSHLLSNQCSNQLVQPIAQVLQQPQISNPSMGFQNYMTSPMDFAEYASNNNSNSNSLPMSGSTCQLSNSNNNNSAGIQVGNNILIGGGPQAQPSQMQQQPQQIFGSSNNSNQGENTIWGAHGEYMRTLGNLNKGGSLTPNSQGRVQNILPLNMPKLNKIQTQNIIISPIKLQGFEQKPQND